VEHEYLHYHVGRVVGESDALFVAEYKSDHVLYSVDWPFTSNEDGKKWLEELEASGLVSKEELQMIACGNAERLLKIEARA